MKIKNKKIKKTIKQKIHKLKPIHLFHNEIIDRWVVLMNCGTCKKIHIFYPFN